MAGERYTPFVNPREGITRRNLYERIRSSLWNERTTNEPHWRELNDYLSPRKARWFVSDRNKGDRRNQKIIDSTGTFSLRTLQSGMHAGMTSPARPWMRLGTPDPDLNEFGPVKEWLHTVTQRMLVVFNQTNLYNALPVHYGCKGLFATAATGMLEDDEQLFRCHSYPIGSYAISTDHRGRVNQWVHESQKTVLEIVEEYLVDPKTNMIDWSRASLTLRNMWDRADFNQMVPVCWIVVPNREFDARYPLDNRKSKPFVSIHIEKGQDRDDTFLREKGYDEFPILVSRWDVTGDDWYGTDCPGMVALGDVKQLQTGEKRSAQAVEKMINPPLQAPTNVRNQKASLLPGDITYNDVREGQKGITPIHETNLPIDKLEAKQQQCRSRIQRAFYEDLFLMLAYSDPNAMGVQRPTATEVVERKEEKLIALGPVLERSKDELHDPMIDRAFAMMDRAGLLPPPPDELRGMKLKVEYISVMAQAQKLVGVVGHERFLQGASSLVAVWPEARHKINVFQAIDDYNEMLGNNPKLVRTDDEAQALAQKEAQAAMAQARAKAMNDGASAVQKLGNTPIEDGTALGRLTQAIGASAGAQPVVPAGQA
jgi:hypothetical protein